MRVLVTGSRGWINTGIVRAELTMAPLRLDADPGHCTLVHGGARGADAVAATIARGLGWGIEEYPADWRKHGRAAGPIRNSYMVSLGADLALAFRVGGERSRGTSDCIQVIRGASIPLILHDVPLIDGVPDYPSGIRRTYDLEGQR
ncbi:MAG: DUF2493 domain-containing protein [Solirubrobacteraceae bacterium]|nr:DUF2493 domain-containing protein [Solirubrobacteraceae bacterium]